MRSRASTKWRGFRMPASLGTTLSWFHVLLRNLGGFPVTWPDNAKQMKVSTNYGTYSLLLCLFLTPIFIEKIYNSLTFIDPNDVSLETVSSKMASLVWHFVGIALIWHNFLAFRELLGPLRYILVTKHRRFQLTKSQMFGILLIGVNYVTSRIVNLIHVNFEDQPSSVLRDTLQMGLDAIIHYLHATIGLILYYYFIYIGHNMDYLRSSVIKTLENVQEKHITEDNTFTRRNQSYGSVVLLPGDLQHQDECKVTITLEGEHIPRYIALAVFNRDSQHNRSASIRLLVQTQREISHMGKVLSHLSAYLGTPVMMMLTVLQVEEVTIILILAGFGEKQNKISNELLFLVANLIQTYLLCNSQHGFNEGVSAIVY